MFTRPAITMPILLESGFMVYIDLPVEPTQAEIDRICAVLQTLPLDAEEPALARPRGELSTRGRVI